jgi:predicted O-methyltransferase YrrM
VDSRGDYEVDGVTFAVDYQAKSTRERFAICKPLDLLEKYRRLVNELQPRRIVELGIARGGSTALMALLADVQKFVAIDLCPEPVEALTAFLEERGLVNRVRPFYGVSQGDRARVTEILAREMAGPLDLVVDDASHLLAETRASFELLFPRLRPGGMYVVEDWAAHHVYAKAATTIAEADARLGVRSHPWLERLGSSLMIDEPGRNEPLSRMVVELILARATSGDAIAELTVDGHWVTVRRGPADLDDGFALADLYVDYFGQV